MTKARTKTRRAWARRLVMVMAALGIAVGASSVAASPASAANGVCRVTSIHRIHVCIAVTQVDDENYRVEASMFVPMSQADAERVIAQPGASFSGTLVADDQSWVTLLAPMPRAIESAHPEGLLGVFDGVFHRSVLDEDDGEDEIYVGMAYSDIDTRFFFQSDTVRVIRPF